MRRLPIYLLGVLCVQIVLALVIYWHNNQQTESHQSQPLLSFDQNTLDKIVIMGPSETVTLSKHASDDNESRWTLTNLNKLPVSQTQLDSALEKLAGLTTNWPIATTPSSHQRFELQDDNFQRRIQLFQGENKVADLLLGSSPGFRKVHLRTLDDDNVYALPLNTFYFPTTDEQWLDKTLLAIDDIKSIEGADYRLLKTADTWTLNALDKDKLIPLDQDKAIGLAKALSNLRVLEFVTEPPVFADASIKTLVIEGEQQQRYQLLEVDEKYYLKDEETGHVFSIGQTDYQRMTGVTLAGLTLSQPEPASETEPSITSKSVPPEI